MKGIITYQEMMRAVYQKDSNGFFQQFKVEFMKYNKQRKTAGEIVTCNAVVVANESGKAKTKQHLDSDNAAKKKHKPRHRSNKTLNIKLIVGGHRTDQIIKIHPLLVLMFNDKEMVL